MNVKSYDFAEIMRMLLDGKFSKGQILINSNCNNAFFTVCKSNIGWSLRIIDDSGESYTPLFGSAQISGKWVIKEK